MNLHYSAKIKCTKEVIRLVNDSIKDSHQNEMIYYSAEGLSRCKGVRLSGIYREKKLVSFAYSMKRIWNDSQNCLNGISIGLVTTVKDERNKGFARQLIRKIEENNRKEGIDFIYLAGIPGFYDKFGFKGFAPKSKIVFRKEDLPNATGTVERLTPDLIHVARTLYEQYSAKINAIFKRDDKTWDELIGPLSSTFVFKDPHVIRDENHKIIGYFCITPGKKDVIREFIPSCDERSVIKALAIVSNYLGLENEHRLEIFAPSRGPIWNVAKESIGADFQCFLRPRSSNMIKWLSNKENSKVNDMFLLQGDLL